jgi:hypothetical protein
MNTTFDPTALLLDVFRVHRAKLTVEVVDLRRRINDLDNTISRAERLLDQHDTEKKRGRTTA